MIRPALTGLALFLTPFALYALFLWATRARAVDAEDWSANVLVWLTMTAFGLMIGAFLLLAQFSGAPPGATYVPAHMQDGKFVPGTTR